MKIAMLGPYPVNNNLHMINGGVQAVIVNMIKGLKRYSDLDIHIITADSSITRALDFDYDGIKIHAVPLDRHLGNITFYSRTRKELCKRVEAIKPDLVHTHMFGYYTMAAFNSGHKKIIVSTHGISNINWGMDYKIKEKVRLYLQDLTYIRCLCLSENVIINSPYAKRSLGNFDNKRIYELNNPISDLFFNLDNNTEEEQRILFAGHICEAKGVNTLLYALNILKDNFRGIKLMLAGQFLDRNFYTEVQRFVKKNSLEKFVNFLGQLGESDLGEEYKKASIFVFPSLQDVAPLALLQAMAAGKAIVTTRVGGIPYIINNGHDGFLIEKKDFEALSERISLLIRDRDLRIKFGSNARKKVSEDYRIEKVVEELHRIYTEVGQNGSYKD